LLPINVLNQYITFNDLQSINKIRSPVNKFSTWYPQSTIQITCCNFLCDVCISARSTIDTQIFWMSVYDFCRRECGKPCASCCDEFTSQWFC